MRCILVFIVLFTINCFIDAQDFKLSRGDTSYISIELKGIKTPFYMVKSLSNSLPYENEREYIFIKGDTLIKRKVLLYHPLNVDLRSDDTRLNASCFLIPNDTLAVFFDIDSTNNACVYFNGKTALVSEYLTHSKYNYRAIPTKEETIERFNSRVDSLNKIAIDSLNSFLFKTKLPDWFVKIEWSAINFRSIYWKEYQYRIRYSFFQQYFSRPINYFKDLNINFNDTYGQFNDWYCNMIWHSLSNPSYDTLLLQVQNRNKNNYAFRKEILLNAKKNLNNSAKDYVFISIISNSLNNLGYRTAIENRDSSYFTQIDSLYNFIKDDFSDSVAYFVLKDYREKQLKKARQAMLIHKGQNTINYNDILPNLYLSTPTGDSICLSNFKGKNVCLNFWATWCGPCIASFPEKNELIEKYSNKSIVFINICIDNNVGLWKRYVSLKGLKGYNVICNNYQANYLKGLYLISAIPQYTLIGTDGGYIIERSHKIEEIEMSLKKIK